jgi:o-succinylbenzoate---CoA ligase
MHPSFVLEIGNQFFPGHKLIEAVQNNHFDFEEEWQKSIVLFLKEWFDADEEVIVKTSGSTGTPQIIRLFKLKMKISAAMSCDYFDLQPRDKALMCLSAANIAGKMMLVRAIERGLHLIAVNPVGCPLSAIGESVKFSAMVPIQVQHCLDNNCLDKTEKLLIGGVSVSDKMLEKLKKLPVECYSSYGMTETMSHVAIKKLNGDDASEWYEGLEGIGFSLDDRGCLKIEALGLGIEKLQTNDLCELKGDHCFKWLGRLDFIINSGGVKISPEPLEKLLSTFMPFPFFITGIPDEKLGEQVVLLVEAPGAEQIPVRQLQQIFSKWPKYQKPKEIYFLPEFAYTPSGKINRNASKTKKRFRV